MDSLEPGDTFLAQELLRKGGVDVIADGAEGHGKIWPSNITTLRKVCFIGILLQWLKQLLGYTSITV
jgi:hypothetical protein